MTTLDGLKEKLKMYDSKEGLKLNRHELNKLSRMVSAYISNMENNKKYYGVDDSMTNRRARWSNDDTKYLIEAYEEGVTDLEMSKALGRSTKAIERKRHLLGLKKYDEYFEKHRS